MISFNRQKKKKSRIWKSGFGAEVFEYGTEIPNKQIGKPSNDTFESHEHSDNHWGECADIPKLGKTKRNPKNTTTLDHSLCSKNIFSTVVL